MNDEKWMKLDILCHMHKSKCQRKFNPKMKIKGLAFLKTNKKQWEKINEYGQTCVQYRLKIKLYLSCKYLMFGDFKLSLLCYHRYYAPFQ